MLAECHWVLYKFIAYLSSQGLPSLVIVKAFVNLKVIGVQVKPPICISHGVCASITSRDRANVIQLWRDLTVQMTICKHIQVLSCCFLPKDFLLETAMRFGPQLVLLLRVRVLLRISKCLSNRVAFSVRVECLALIIFAEKELHLLALWDGFFYQ